MPARPQRLGVLLGFWDEKAESVTDASRPLASPRFASYVQLGHGILLHLTYSTRSETDYGPFPRFSRLA